MSFVINHKFRISVIQFFINPKTDQKGCFCVRCPDYKKKYIILDIVSVYTKNILFMRTGKVIDKQWLNVVNDTVRTLTRIIKYTKDGYTFDNDDSFVDTFLSFLENPDD